MCTVSSFHLRKTGFSRSEIIGKVRVSVWGLDWMDVYVCVCCVFGLFSTNFKSSYHPFIPSLSPYPFHSLSVVLCHSLAMFRHTTLYRYGTLKVHTAMSYLCMLNVFLWTMFRFVVAMSLAMRVTQPTYLNYIRTYTLQCTPFKMTMMAFRMRVCVCKC